MNERIEYEIVDGGSFRHLAIEFNENGQESFLILTPTGSWAHCEATEAEKALGREIAQRRREGKSPGAHVISWGPGEVRRDWQE